MKKKILIFACVFLFLINSVFSLTWYYNPIPPVSSNFYNNTNNSEFLDGYDSSYFMPLNKTVVGDFIFNGNISINGSFLIKNKLQIVDAIRDFTSPVPKLSVDSNNRFLGDTSDNVALYWAQRNLTDISEITTVDWNNRKLYGSWNVYNKSQVDTNLSLRYLATNPDRYINMTNLTNLAYAQYNFSTNQFNGTGDFITRGDLRVERGSGLINLSTTLGGSVFFIDSPSTSGVGMEINSRPANPINEKSKIDFKGNSSLRWSIYTSYQSVTFKDFSIFNNQLSSEAINIRGSTNNIGIDGVDSPTAKIHISGGNGGVGNSSLKINEGTLLIVPEDGAIEHDNKGYLYFTSTAFGRNRIVTNDSDADSWASNYTFYYNKSEVDANLSLRYLATNPDGYFNETSNVTIRDLAGVGNAYVCINATGGLYRSGIACV
jgi:hypothetical protein